MAYSTADDLVRLVGVTVVLELSDDSGVAAGVTADDVAEKINDAIEQADNEVDAYLGTVLDLPLDVVPGIITDISARIALYNLSCRRPHVEDDSWEKQYKRSLKLLAKIQDGSLHFGNSKETPDEPEKKSIMVNTSKKLFPHSAWERF